MTTRIVVAAVFLGVLMIVGGGMGPVPDDVFLTTLHAQDCGRNNDHGEPDDDCEEEQPDRTRNSVTGGSGDFEDDTNTGTFCATHGGPAECVDAADVTISIRIYRPSIIYSPR